MAYAKTKLTKLTKIRAFQSKQINAYENNECKRMQTTQVQTHNVNAFNHYRNPVGFNDAHVLIKDQILSLCVSYMISKCTKNQHERLK